MKPLQVCVTHGPFAPHSAVVEHICGTPVMHDGRHDDPLTLVPLRRKQHTCIWQSAASSHWNVTPIQLAPPGGTSQVLGSASVDVPSVIAPSFERPSDPVVLASGETCLPPHADTAATAIATHNLISPILL